MDYRKIYLIEIHLFTICFYNFMLSIDLSLRIDVGILEILIDFSIKENQKLVINQVLAFIHSLLEITLTLQESICVLMQLLIKWIYSRKMEPNYFLIKIIFFLQNILHQNQLFVPLFIHINKVCDMIPSPVITTIYNLELIN